MQRWRKEAREDENKMGKERWREREVEKTVIKKRCGKPFSSDVFSGNLSLGEESESAEEFFFFCLWESTGVLAVTAAPFTPSSVGVLGEDFLSVSDCEFIESQCFSVSLESVKPFLLKVKQA